MSRAVRSEQLESDDVPALFQRHYLELVRLAMRLADDQESAEDLVQDVFLALARSNRDIRDPLRYLRRAVLNRSRSALRRRRVVRLFAARHLSNGPAEPADAAMLRGESRRQLLRAIRSLPPRQREVVVLRYYEDLQVAEIADLLGTSAGAVSSALNRALTALSATSEDSHVD